MTVLSLPYLGLSIRNWLAISFSGGVYRPEFKSFFLSKKYRLLRCSLLSKLDIWKRIVELVRTCSLWLLHILLLDVFHLNTRCRHTRVHLEFTFEVRMYFTCFCLKCVKEALVYMVSIYIFGIKQCHRLP